MSRALALITLLTTSLAPASAWSGDAVLPKNALLSPCISTVEWEEATLFRTIKGGLGLAAEGFGQQFVHGPSLATFGLGAGACWLADEYDDKWLAEISDVEFLTDGWMNVLGDETSIALGFAPLVTLYLSRWMKDEKLYHFSVETFASMMVAWTETVALSQIDYHERPRDAGSDPASSFFDTALRGRSSWPSGHMVAPFTLTFKVWDYYGWKAGLVPAGLTAITAANRVADGSHYPSDVVAAGVLSFAAHLATKKVKSKHDGFHFNAAPLHKGLLVGAGWRF